MITPTNGLSGQDFSLRNQQLSNHYSAWYIDVCKAAVSYCTVCYADADDDSGGDNDAAVASAAADDDQFLFVGYRLHGR